MFVAAKNLCSQERVYLPANQFVILDNEKKVRRPFQPTDENDFLFRDESYGVIKGSLIERHYLLMIKGSLEELHTQKKRWGDPKRTSIAPAFVKVKDFPLESQKDSRKTKKTSAVDSRVKAQREEEKKVLSKFLNAGSEPTEKESKRDDLGKTNDKKDKIGGRAKTIHEQAEKNKETSDEKKTILPANQPTEKPRETKTKGDNLGKANKKGDKIGSRAETTSNGITEEDKETELGEETTNGPPANEPTEKTGELNRLDGQCCDAAAELRRLQAKYASLEEENEQLRLAAEQSTTLRKMQEDLAALKKSTVLKIPHTPQPARGVSVEPEFEGIDVSEDKVYIGQGKFIGRHEFLEAEDYASFGLRARALCEAFWPGEVHMYSKTGGVAKGLRQGDDETVSKDSEERTQYRRIHPMYHLALKTLLCQMSWGHGVDPRMVVTKEKVNRFLSEHPLEIRRNLKKRSKQWENREKKACCRKSKNDTSHEQHKRTRRNQSALSSDSDENTPRNGQRQLTSRAAKRTRKLPEQQADAMSEEDQLGNGNIEESTSPVRSEEGSEIVSEPE